MPKFNLKRIIAVKAVTFGVLFTLFALLTIWEMIEIPQTIINKLIPTLGILTTAFIALLGIMKMVENKDRTKPEQG